MKMNKDMERLIWTKQFGLPLYESLNHRFLYKDNVLKSFNIKNRKWRTVFEDEEGFYHVVQPNANYQPSVMRFTEEITKELREIIIEKELLGK